MKKTEDAVSAVVEPPNYTSDCWLDVARQQEWAKLSIKYENNGRRPNTEIANQTGPTRGG